MSNGFESLQQVVETVRGDVTDAPTRSWRADLWPNVPSAINWANEIPICQPGEIIYNIRDNGQVWTYTFGVWD